MLPYNHYSITETRVNTFSVKSPMSFNVDWTTFIDKIYPVGSIYMSVNNVSPQSFMGGTWVAWGSGRVPVGVNTSDSSFNTVEKTGGEKTHVLSHDELPQTRYFKGDVDSYDYSNQLPANLNLSAGTGYGFKYPYTGRNYGHNNLQPYITCYMWKRTA